MSEGISVGKSEAKAKPDRTGQSITGLRIAIPWVLALIAPLVMAPKYAQVYEPAWDALPGVTRVTIHYGLFLQSHIWLAFVLGAVVIGAFQIMSHHPKLTDGIKRAFPALHLSGVLIAILVIFTFYLPLAMTRIG